MNYPTHAVFSTKKTAKKTMNSINNSFKSINFLNIYNNNYISNTKQHPYPSITSETDLKHNIKLHKPYLDYDKHNTNVLNSTNSINKNNLSKRRAFTRLKIYKQTKLRPTKKGTKN